VSRARCLPGVEGRARCVSRPSSPGGRSAASQVVAQVVGVEDDPVGNGVEAGPFVGLLLQGVDLDDDGIGVYRRGNHAGAREEEAGVVAPLYGAYSQFDHTDQGVGDAAGREQSPDRLRDAEAEVGNGVPFEPRWPSRRLHRAAAPFNRSLDLPAE